MQKKEKLQEEIKSYCELNDLNVDDFIYDLLKKAFIEEKYGKAPPILEKKETNKNNIMVKTIKTINVNDDSIIEPEKIEVKSIKRKLS